MKLKPENKPLRPYFSSGPCSKRPGWKIENLSKAIIGRSHRSKIALKTIYEVISLTKEILEIPEDYYVGIVPASGFLTVVTFSASNNDRDDSGSCRSPLTIASTGQTITQAGS